MRNKDGVLLEVQEKDVATLTFRPGKFWDGIHTIGSLSTRNVLLPLFVEMEIPDSVTTIEDEAFRESITLRKVKLPNTIETIPYCCFWGCKNLRRVIIPNSVKKLGLHSFNGCKSLKRIDIPDSVETIDMCAFMSCDNLQEINLGNSVKVIGPEAFSGCTNLRYLELPQSIEKIRKLAFDECDNLEVICFPIKKVDIYFAHTPKTRYVYIDEENNQMYFCKSHKNIDLPYIVVDDIYDEDDSFIDNKGYDEVLKRVNQYINNKKQTVSRR